MNTGIEKQNPRSSFFIEFTREAELQYPYPCDPCQKDIVDMVIRIRAVYAASKLNKLFPDSE